MKEMELYRVLQAHVGIINSLVVRLYKGEIEADVALEAAKAENDALTEKLKSGLQLPVSG